MGGRIVIRRRSQEASVPDAVRAVARGLAAGLPLGDAFRRGADAVDARTAEMMRCCCRALDDGEPLATALGPLREVDGGDVAAAAIDLHQELGGDLVAALHGVAEGLADRERLRVEARAITAQARVASRIVPLAPVAALGMLAVLAPTSARSLVTDPIGLGILVLAASMTLVALVLVRRIARGAGL